MIFLRARWYDVRTGRFASQDPWPGSIYQPSSLHKFLYVSANPVNLVDPSGLIAEGEEAEKAREIISNLRRYSVMVQEDFGWKLFDIPLYISGKIGTICNIWVDGNWKSVWELEQVQAGIMAMADEMSQRGDPSVFARKVGRTVVKRYSAHPKGYLGLTGWNITFYDAAFWEPSGVQKTSQEVANTVVHEFAHAWDVHHLSAYSTLMRKVTKGGWINGKYDPGGTPVRGPGGDPYNIFEDWAEAVSYNLFPLPDYEEYDDVRETFVDEAFAARNIGEFDRTIRHLFPSSEWN